MFKALRSLFTSPDDPREALRPLYRAVVAAARAPHWYRHGGVADTVDGRFEMVAALLALTIVRIEALPGHQRAMALLTEIFVEDMDAQLRQQGVGDVVVGKHVGKMMGALGGRIAAYRAGFGESGDAAAALVRNLYRGTAPGDAEVAHAIAAMRGYRDSLAMRDADALLAGDIATGPLR